MARMANQFIIGTAATKRSYVSRPETREWVSVIDCVGALGHVLTPLLIYKGKAVQQQWFMPGETPDFVYTTSDNAFTTNEIGLRWLREIFISQTARDLADDEYRLLLVDGHGSHTTIESMWECFQNKIIPYYLVAHASHILQPLDLTVFSSLKRTYRAAVAIDSHFEDNAPVKKQRFVRYYAQARATAMTETNIKSGFAAAGIHPFCPTKVLRSPFLIANQSDSDILQQQLQTATSTSSDSLISTPRNRRQLKHALSALNPTSPLGRDTRLLLRKTTNAFDRLQFDLASTRRRLFAVEQQAIELKARSSKKQAVDANKQFVNIADIKAAQDQMCAATAAPKASKRANKVTKFRDRQATVSTSTLRQRISQCLSSWWSD